MNSWIKPMARAGYAARGVVYLIIGFLAALAAFGNSEAKGSKGALQSLLGQPFGEVLVWLMIAGLIAFSVWRLIQSFADADNHGTDAKGLAVRTALVGSAISHGVLAFVALGLVSAWGADEGGGSDPTASWLATIYEWGLGAVVLYGIVSILVVVAIAHMVKAAKAGFEKYFKCDEDVMRWLRPVSQFGLAARGVVFLIIAGLLFRGGLSYSAENKPGLEEALKAVQGYPFGWVILLIIALGLIAFGIYCLAEARYREVGA